VGCNAAGGQNFMTERSTTMARKNAGAKRRTSRRGNQATGGASARSRRDNAQRRGGRAGGAKSRRTRTRKTSGRKGGGGGTAAARSSSRGGARGEELSRATLRAKWIESPDEHAERPGQTLATRDHEVIRRWAEERGAAPATIPGTERDDRPGVLRLDFPGYGGGQLQRIDWDDWFRTFDERGLVFLFQERLKSGRQSNFFRFDSPEREAA